MSCEGCKFWSDLVAESVGGRLRALCMHESVKGWSNAMRMTYAGCGYREEGEPLDSPSRSPEPTGWDESLDRERIDNQRARVSEFMFSLSRDEWVTLEEISAMTNFPEASISARLRDLRKKRYGAHDVQKRRREPGRAGVWEYRVVRRIPPNVSDLPLYE